MKLLVQLLLLASLFAVAESQNQVNKETVCVERGDVSILQRKQDFTLIIIQTIVITLLIIIREVLHHYRIWVTVIYSIINQFAD